MEEFAEWLQSQEFYELCQQYRHARDIAPSSKGLLTAAEAFENLKQEIIAKAKSCSTTLK